MKCTYWLLILNLAFICVSGQLLECYKCLEKIKGSCYYGNTKDIRSFNCSKNYVCVTHKSQTTQGSFSFTTTTRGCEYEGICKDIFKNPKASNTTKDIYCETCNTTLCNSSTNTTPTGIVMLHVMYFLTNIIYVYFGINSVHNQCILLGALVLQLYVAFPCVILSFFYKHSRYYDEMSVFDRILTK